MLDEFLDKLRYIIVQETNFSKYHILWLILYALVLFYLIVFCKNASELKFRILLFIFGFSLFIGEILKILCHCHFDGKFTFINDYIPWQFCSTPLYFFWICPLMKNKLAYQTMLTYLSTYCIVAGTAAIIPAESIFTDLAFDNLHTLLLHGGMVVIGIYVQVSNRLDYKWITFVNAVCLFFTTAFIAQNINFITYMKNPATATDMYFISPFVRWGPTNVMKLFENVPYWAYFAGYLLSFTLASYIIFVISKNLHKIKSRKNVPTTE